MKKRTLKAIKRISRQSGKAPPARVIEDEQKDPRRARREARKTLRRELAEAEEERHQGFSSLPQRFNAAEALLDANLKAGRGGKAALRSGGKSLTYGRVVELANRTGNMLLSLGLRQESRVALILQDSFEFVVSFLGSIKAGLVPVPFNTFLRPTEHAFLLNDCRARVALVHGQLLPCLGALRAELPFLQEVISVGGEGEGNSFESLLSFAPAHLRPADTHRDEPAFWLYSSGSTGRPKAVVHLHHDIVFCCEAFGRHVLEIGEQDTTFSISKLFFAYGLGNNLYYPFHVGATALLDPEPAAAEKALTLISRERPSIFFAVPTFYASMLEVEGAEERFDLSSLRLCISAGEALPAELYCRWRERFGLEILDGLGSTEMLQTFISNRAGRVKPGSSGTLVPGYEARVVDEEGREVPHGQVGSLLVRGDSSSPYYWNRHRESKLAVQGGWVRTGDRYRRDEDGYFWYCGRSDDMLKVGGIWVSPVEVERALAAHPAVREAAVVGAPDRRGLIKPKAFVTLRAGHEASRDLAGELIDFVKGRLASHKAPRWVEFLEELPKTATGKIRRFELREKENSGPLRR